MQLLHSLYFEYSEGEVGAVTQEEQKYSYEYDKGRLVTVNEGEAEHIIMTNVHDPFQFIHYLSKGWSMQGDFCRIIG